MRRPFDGAVDRAKEGLDRLLDAYEADDPDRVLGRQWRRILIRGRIS